VGATGAQVDLDQRGFATPLDHAVAERGAHRAGAVGAGFADERGVRVFSEVVD
jgi:hypothetical protein